MILVVNMMSILLRDLRFIPWAVRLLPIGAGTTVGPLSGGRLVAP